MHLFTQQIEHRNCLWLYNDAFGYADMHIHVEWFIHSFVRWLACLLALFVLSVCVFYHYIIHSDKCGFLSLIIVQRIRMAPSSLHFFYLAQYFLHCFPVSPLIILLAFFSCFICIRQVNMQEAHICTRDCNWNI